MNHYRVKKEAKKEKKAGRKRSYYFETVALLVGTIVGAGVLGIPYVVAQSGLLLGFLNLFFLGLIILLINLYVGEISLRTKNTHMLAGYAEKYLGKWGKAAMTITTLFGIYGAMVAYTIGEGEVLSNLFGGSSLIWGLTFFAIFSCLIYFKLKVIAESELLLSGIMIFLILLIGAIAIFQVDLNNLTTVNLSNVFLPYGVIFFAFLGVSSIPEMREELKKNPKKLKSAIALGSIIPIVIYALFTAVVVGVTGIGTTEVATIGLGEKLGTSILLLGNLFAIFSMATSFLLLGFAIKWMYHYDYSLSKPVAWVLAWIVPLMIILSGARNFIGIVGLTGAVAGGLEGILIILTVMAAKKKSERKPEYSIPLNWGIAIFLILIFLSGIAYQFLI